MSAVRSLSGAKRTSPNVDQVPLHSGPGPEQDTNGRSKGETLLPFHRHAAWCLLTLLKFTRVGPLSARVAHIATNLFFIAPARQVADPHCGPAQLSHELRQMPKGASCSAALRHLKHI